MGARLISMFATCASSTWLIQCLGRFTRWLNLSWSSLTLNLSEAWMHFQMSARSQSLRTRTTYNMGSRRCWTKGMKPSSMLSAWGSNKKEIGCSFTARTCLCSGSYSLTSRRYSLIVIIVNLTHYWIFVPLPDLFSVLFFILTEGSSSIHSMLGFFSKVKQSV